MNRSDSAALIIPKYVQLGIMPENPFQRLNEQIVGKAIIKILHLTNLLSMENKRATSWALVEK